MGQDADESQVPSLYTQVMATLFGLPMLDMALAIPSLSIQPTASLFVPRTSYFPSNDLGLAPNPVDLEMSETLPMTPYLASRLGADLALPSTMDHAPRTLLHNQQPTAVPYLLAVGPRTMILVDKTQFREIHV